MSNTISVTVNIEFPIKKVWEFLICPFHVSNWTARNHIYSNIIKEYMNNGGTFNFPFEYQQQRVYSKLQKPFVLIIPFKFISYHLPDKRLVKINLKPEAESTKITLVIERHPCISLEFQERFCSNLISSFKNYVLALNKSYA